MRAYFLHKTTQDNWLYFISLHCPAALLDLANAIPQESSKASSQLLTTKVLTDSDVQFSVREMRDAEGADGTHDVKCHVSNLADVVVAVSLRQPAGEHVGILSLIHI